MEPEDRNKAETKLVPFFEHHIEGYLFSDLKNMQKIELGPDEWVGSCGYPMIMSLLSASELLGALISRSAFNPNAGRLYFSDFWKHYLNQSKPIYGIPNLSETVYQLTRHALAHLSITKPGIYVSKSGDRDHLQYDSEKQILLIDAITFFDDFKSIYQNIIKPLALGSITQNGVDHKSMQKRLGELIDFYNKDSVRRFALLPIKISPHLTTSAAHASLSMEPKPLSASFTYTPPQV